MHGVAASAVIAHMDTMLNQKSGEKVTTGAQASRR
jgi:hypothetical protein